MKNQEEEKKCPECSWPGSLSARFCERCGYLYDRESIKVCPDCKEDCNLDDNYCQVCGYEFKKYIERFDLSDPKVRQDMALQATPEIKKQDQELNSRLK